MTRSPEASRSPTDSITATYASYDLDPARQRAWRPTEPLEVFYRLGRINTLARLLRVVGSSLEDAVVLDVGCGYGRSLIDLMVLGADPGRLHGIDVLPDRVERLRRWLPPANVRSGDARELPWPDGHFDFVTQFTALSSIPELRDRRAVVSEIRRVLRPDGLFFSWDLIARFGSSPAGLSRKQLVELCQPNMILAATTGLDPRIASRVIRKMPMVARNLEQVGVAPSHLAAVIRFTPQRGGA
jgi:ubiquinone/menaquinone biosynthesis C-methylase UbiE